MQTLLFRDVVEVETGQPLRDHVWLREGPWWATGGLNMVGVTVDMTVTIGPVIKGWLGDHTLHERSNSIYRARWLLMVSLILLTYGFPSIVMV